ncbi:hypothetical protein FA13DRAFT_1717221 [Coprinellus micaceus]|uniref:Uncharacterized protein n=1 Tax=Coprinellus micaceus TaxID=71717 RepID=A0A4Y7SHC3_COPMI|nr:hypothetical protein FA13DRAFT_1717221 [Coprinellus micaceus]
MTTSTTKIASDNVIHVNIRPHLTTGCDVESTLDVLASHEPRKRTRFGRERSQAFIGKPEGRFRRTVTPETQPAKHRERITRRRPEHGEGCGDAFALGREVPNHRLFPDWEGDDGRAMSRTLGEHDGWIREQEQEHQELKERKRMKRRDRGEGRHKRLENENRIWFATAESPQGITSKGRHITHTDGAPIVINCRYVLGSLDSRHYKHLPKPRDQRQHPVAPPAMFSMFMGVHSRNGYKVVQQSDQVTTPFARTCVGMGLSSLRHLEILVLVSTQADLIVVGLPFDFRSPIAAHTREHGFQGWAFFHQLLSGDPAQPMFDPCAALLQGGRCHDDLNNSTLTITSFHWNLGLRMLEAQFESHPGILGL